MLTLEFRVAQVLGAPAFAKQLVVKATTRNVFSLKFLSRFPPPQSRRVCDSWWCVYCTCRPHCPHCPHCSCSYSYSSSSCSSCPHCPPCPHCPHCPHCCCCVFQESGGLADRLMKHMLQPGSPPGLVVDSLLLLSQLARISKDYYPAIDAAEVSPDRRAIYFFSFCLVLRCHRAKRREKGWSRRSAREHNAVAVSPVFLRACHRGCCTGLPGDRGSARPRGADGPGQNLQLDRESLQALGLLLPGPGPARSISFHLRPSSSSRSPCFISFHLLILSFPSRSSHTISRTISNHLAPIRPALPAGPAPAQRAAAVPDRSADRPGSQHPQGQPAANSPAS